ncbi:MAG: hypothetical protein ACLFWF_05290 [Alphaproteobacteria bacterium]
MDDTLYPVASRHYWAGLGERRPPQALAKARLLHDRDPVSVWEKWFTAHPSPGVDLRAGPRFTSSDLVLRTYRLRVANVVRDYGKLDRGQARPAAGRPTLRTGNEV